MQTQKKKLFKTVATAAVCTCLLGVSTTTLTANADSEAEKVYYQDTLFHGYGTMVQDYTYVYCDEVRTETLVIYSDAPSYGNTNSSLTNACGAISGLNVLVYYDRHFPNIFPDFEPGMVSAGNYLYFPDMRWDETQAALVDIYNLMQIGTVGGTTSANFRSGLATYMGNRSCTTTYSTFYESETTVNLNTLATAINAGKVGVVMCSAYNYIYSMDYSVEDGGEYIVQVNSQTGHIMMVYGYKTMGYYTDGVKTDEKTFLLVSSGYGTAEQGYMELEDFSEIDEAWIVNVS